MCARDASGWMRSSSWIRFKVDGQPRPITDHTTPKCEAHSAVAVALVAHPKRRRRGLPICARPSLALLCRAIDLRRWPLRVPEAKCANRPHPLSLPTAFVPFFCGAHSIGSGNRAPTAAPASARQRRFLLRLAWRDAWRGAVLDQPTDDGKKKSNKRSVVQMRRLVWDGLHRVIDGTNASVMVERTVQSVEKLESPYKTEARTFRGMI